VREEAVAAGDRLDAVLRQYLDEASGELVDPEALMALAATGLRLRRVADGIDLIPAEPWFEMPGLGSSPRLEAMAEQVAGWYSELGDAIEGRETPPAPLAVDPQIPEALIARLEEDRLGAGIARIWLFENLAYLTELSVRFNQRARDLFGAQSG
jgi:hypothetical protein